MFDFPGMLPQMAVMLLLWLIPLVLDIIAFVDLARRPMEPLYKVFWVAVILVAPCLGALAYFIVGRTMQSGRPL